LVGVDDNGSGVVAMLEVARQLSEMNKKGIKRKNTILFAAIDLEEYGMRCINIFVPLSFFFWRLSRVVCPPLRILVIPLVSSNSSIYTLTFLA
jgi:hypothetical protein